MLLLQKILSFVVLLGALITVHELGHLLAAKLVGVKVVKFSVGFGRKLFGFTYGGTEYVLAWIPLGGFVRMAGELPKDMATLTPEEEARSFLLQPWWKRAVIALAGPAFNIAFPVLVFFAVFWGPAEVLVPRIGSVVPQLPAAQAGLLPGDLLTKIDGVPIYAFSDISELLQKRLGKDMVVEFQRDGVVHSVQLRPQTREAMTPFGKKPQGFIGVSLDRRPAVLGILPGSAGEAAGLKTFDRVVELNGEPVRDERELLKALEAASSPLQLRIARTRPGEAGQKPEEPQLLSLAMPKQEGLGYEALGAMPRDLFVAEVLVDSPAAKAGLKRGDLLLAWNGQALTSWEALAQHLKVQEGQPFVLSWHGSEGVHEATLEQEKKEKLGEFKHPQKFWDLGLKPHRADLIEPETQRVHIGFWQAWGKALKIVPEVTVNMAAMIVKLLTGQASSEEREGIGGPILVFQAAAKSIEQGWESYLHLLAFVSINLALVNLLPLPILDGFTVLSATWEGIRRKPLPMRFREIANLVGLLVLVFLMGYAFKNDIVRLLR